MENQNIESGKTQVVVNMDTLERYFFTNCTPIQAMQRMRNYLGISSKCDAAINKTTSGYHLYMRHNGMTYAVRNQ